MKYTKLHKIVGSNIKYYRQKLNLTQEQLAEKCDLSPRYISNIENGTGNIALDKIYKLAISLNVQPYILLKDKNSK